MTLAIFSSKKSNAEFWSYNLLIIGSVAIKVVLGAKRDEEKPKTGGYILFLDRSEVGFKYIFGFACLAVILDPNVL